MTQTVLKCPFRPLRGYAVIQAVAENNSAIVMPDTATPGVSGKMIVVEVGPADYHPTTGNEFPLQLRRGDRVLLRLKPNFKKHEDGNFYMVIGQDDVIAVVEA